jgi:hypothetical protein
MAAEAEASREARAKVVAAEGEMKASRALKEAADVMHDSPGALQVPICCLNLVAIINVLFAAAISTNAEQHFGREELHGDFSTADRPHQLFR